MRGFNRNTGKFFFALLLTIVTCTSVVAQDFDMMDPAIDPLETTEVAPDISDTPADLGGEVPEVDTETPEVVGGEVPEVFDGLTSCKDLVEAFNRNATELKRLEVELKTKQDLLSIASINPEVLRRMVPGVVDVDDFAMWLIWELSRIENRIAELEERQRAIIERLEELGCPVEMTSPECAKLETQLEAINKQLAVKYPHLAVSRDNYWKKLSSLPGDRSLHSPAEARELERLRIDFAAKLREVIALEAQGQAIVDELSKLGCGGALITRDEVEDSHTPMP